MIKMDILYILFCSITQKTRLNTSCSIHLLPKQKKRRVQIRTRHLLRLIVYTVHQHMPILHYHLSLLLAEYQLFPQLDAKSAQTLHSAQPL